MLLSYLPDLLALPLFDPLGRRHFFVVQGLRPINFDCAVEAVPGWISRVGTAAGESFFALKMNSIVKESRLHLNNFNNLDTR